MVWQAEDANTAPGNFSGCPVNPPDGTTHILADTPFSILSFPWWLRPACRPLAISSSLLLRTHARHGSKKEASIGGMGRDECNTCKGSQQRPVHVEPGARACTIANRNASTPPFLIFILLLFLFSLLSL